MSKNNEAENKRQKRRRDEEMKEAPRDGRWNIQKGSEGRLEEQWRMGMVVRYYLERQCGAIRSNLWCVASIHPSIIHTYRDDSPHTSISATLSRYAPVYSHKYSITPYTRLTGTIRSRDTCVCSLHPSIQRVDSHHTYSNTYGVDPPQCLSVTFEDGWRGEHVEVSCVNIWARSSKPWSNYRTEIM